MYGHAGMPYMPIYAWWIGTELNRRSLGFNQVLYRLSYRSDLVEGEGVEPPKPKGRLVYSQGISPRECPSEIWC